MGIEVIGVGLAFLSGQGGGGGLVALIIFRSLSKGYVRKHHAHEHNGEKAFQLCHI
jgi:hypothetical protein